MRILLYYFKYIKSEKRGHESVVTQGGKHKYWHVLLVAGAGGLVSVFEFFVYACGIGKFPGWGIKSEPQL